MPVHLARRLVGLEIPDAADPHVVRISERDGPVYEGDRPAPTALLEGGELGAITSPVGEGSRKVHVGVVVTADAVLKPPRGQLVAPLVPEALEVELTSTPEVLFGDILSGAFSSLVGVEVLTHQPQQGVLAEPGSSQVTTKSSDLLGAGVDFVLVRLDDLGERRGLGHVSSIGT